MPALPPVVNTLRVKLTWSDGTDTTANTILYWGYSGSQPVAADCNAFSAAFGTQMGDHASLWDGSTVLNTIETTDLATNSGMQGFATPAIEGTRTGQALTGGTSLLTNYNIARRYRGGKPRNYWPWGVATDLATKQAWSSAFITEAHNAWAAITSGFVGQLEGSTTIVHHANVSYYEGFTSVQNPITKRWRNAPNVRAVPVQDVITGFTVSAVPGSQRRRNR